MTDNRAAYWERFANESAENYIYTPTNQGGIDKNQFVQKGLQCAQQILSESGPYLHGHELVVEYGCGVGRILIPMASSFSSALGIDISPTMLQKLEVNSRERDRENISSALSTSSWEEPIAADLIYSWMVFQHIESVDVLNTALRKIRAGLKPDVGAAYLQFDARPRTILYRLRAHVPDRFLPRYSRRGIRCIRRSPDEIRQMLADAGLNIVAESRATPKKIAFILTAPGVGS